MMLACPDSVMRGLSTSFNTSSWYMPGSLPTGRRMDSLRGPLGIRIGSIFGAAGGAPLVIALFCRSIWARIGAELSELDGRMRLKVPVPQSATPVATTAAAALQAIQSLCRCDFAADLSSVNSRKHGEQCTT